MEGDGGSTSSDAGFMILRPPKVSRKAYSFTQASAFLFPGSAAKSKPRCQTSFNPVPLDQLPKQFPQTADDKNCEDWKKDGDCEYNEEGMVDNGDCAFTCRCSADQDSPSGQECQDWASRGDCRENPGGMTECKYACNWCIKEVDPGASMQHGEN